MTAANASQPPAQALQCGILRAILTKSPEVARDLSRPLRTHSPKDAARILGALGIEISERTLQARCAAGLILTTPLSGHHLITSAELVRLAGFDPSEVWS